MTQMTPTLFKNFKLRIQPIIKFIIIYRYLYILKIIIPYEMTKYHVEWITIK